MNPTSVRKHLSPMAWNRKLTPLVPVKLLPKPLAKIVIFLPTETGHSVPQMILPIHHSIRPPNPPLSRHSGSPSMLEVSFMAFTQSLPTISRPCGTELVIFRSY